MNWFSIQHKGDTARVCVFGELGCWNVGFEAFEQALGDAAKVELVIDSPGGDSYTALWMARLLESRDVTATLTGTCCSSAITLALGARRILCYPDARLMVHSPINFCFGSPSELRRQADDLDRIIEPIKRLYEKRCAPALVEKWFASGDHWLSPAEALACGLVDEVLEVPSLPERAEVTEPGTAAPSGPTEQERFFFDMLQAVGPLRITDRQRFEQTLGVWLSNVRTL